MIRARRQSLTSWSSELQKTQYDMATVVEGVMAKTWRRLAVTAHWWHEREASWSTDKAAGFRMWLWKTRATARTQWAGA